MVRMRDRVRLATDVYLPEGAGRVPAVLVRMPYDKCGRYTFMPQLAPLFNARGYAFVVQDVRGKFRSEGETMPFVHEIEDGYDTLDWIAAQPWCDGHIGMWGDSYYGYTQWAAAASGHPALKAIVPRVTSTDFKVRNWWGDSIVQLYSAGYLAECWLDQLEYRFGLDWNIRPLAHVMDEAFAAVGRRSACCDLMIGVDAPGALPQLPSSRRLLEHKVPVLHSVGWFDNICPFSFDDYERLIALGDKRDLQYLVADSTDHEMYHLSRWPITPADDHAANDDALEVVMTECTGPGLDFFDVFLKETTPRDRLPRARWFLGNAGWRTSPSWPPPGHRELRLYLGDPLRAYETIEGGTLLATPDSVARVAGWVHDPADLVPSTAPDPFALLHSWADEREVQARGDVLTFTGEPLAEPLDLTGPVAAYLGLHSTCSSMHVFAKLCDVFPDGSSRMLVRGESLVQEKDFGRPVEVRMSHTAYRLLPGHRLRLSLASSDFPLYLWHPGVEGNPWWVTSGAANGQALMTGGTSPSYIRLEVLP
jgi:uncharacterized protein